MTTEHMTIDETINQLKVISNKVQDLAGELRDLETKGNEEVEGILTLFGMMLNGACCALAFQLNNRPDQDLNEPVGPAIQAPRFVG